jgi:thymidylate kinase
VAAYRLGRELVVWRDRVLPHCARAQGQKLAVLLVERSLLSRTMIPRAMRVPDVADSLYPEKARITGRKLSADLVCPDIILHLSAPKSTLLSRLDLNDAKYEFRRRLIEETHTWFEDAVDYLPPHLRARIVQIDASRDRDAVFAEILPHLLNGLRHASYAPPPSW